MKSTPSNLGKYLIKEEIGRGAMGVVYKAYDPDIDRDVAIKTLHAHLIDGESGKEFLQRFKREAQTAAKCVHTNIVAVLDYGQQDNTPFIVMEYVDGTPLDFILKNAKSISIKQSLSITSQVLKALHSAHNNKIVHRDIKPANIIILDNGHVKLADFGIARIPNNNEITQIGMVVGTPKYMSPEQTAGKEVDHRSDLFSTVLVLLTLLKRISSNSGTTFSTLERLPGLPETNVIDYTQPIPSALVPVIQKGLEPFPKDRHQDVREFMADLKEAATLLSLHGSTKSPDLSTSSQVNRPNRRSKNESSLTMTSRSISNASSISTRSQLSMPGLASGIDEATLSKLKEDYSKYMGNRSDNIIKEQMQDVISFAELTHSLANKIEKKRHKNAFIKKWSQ